MLVSNEIAQVATAGFGTLVCGIVAFTVYFLREVSSNVIDLRVDLREIKVEVRNIKDDMKLKEISI